ncbi:tRNA-binding protein [Bacillus mesophilus]|uniref:DUF4479 domain-containing protein n=1 Tax=Bacillus mesophilus TaxID=1808955 RepID=A0A6M0Q6J3_9BACI|nr:DUF4479 family protein [Bacillus mesophilus]MBM7660494.1 tRNA-binding protein [Bacillus mesophilus]NEY71955.1 DUF4479 domain-containing protein [Bacillus mesophilus]
MNVFYNEEGISDTLLIALKDVNRELKSFETKGNVTRIFNSETNGTVGYNIFQASTYIKLTDVGSVALTKELVQSIQDVLKQNGWDETLEVDLSPKFVVGLVTEKVKHPDADKLNVCKVDVGEQVLQIVCGGPNVDEGQKVVVAKVGAVMPSGLIIKDAELRGIASSGMICSARELDLPNAPEEKGILVLEDRFVVGQEFK